MNSDIENLPLNKVPVFRVVVEKVSALNTVQKISDIGHCNNLRLRAICTPLLRSL